MNSNQDIEQKAVCEVCKSSDDVIFLTFKYDFLIWRCTKCRIGFQTPMKDRLNS